VFEADKESNSHTERKVVPVAAEPAFGRERGEDPARDARVPDRDSRAHAFA
jgi:hypothetical protein